VSLLTQSRRLFDEKPWTGHIYVTANCNLDCDYCNEYDNSVPHPDTEDVKRWIRKIRELGCLRLGYMGGEPLLHPDIVELVRFGKELGFQRLSMSTNGFLLTKELLEELEEAGLDSMQFSIDRMTPNAITKKSLKTVRHKLEWFHDSSINFNANSVLCEATMDDVDEVIDTCLDEGVGVHARVIHDDLIHQRKLRNEDVTEPLLELIEYQKHLKARGHPIHTSWNLLDVQEEILRDEMRPWKCVAGYKYFFVSADGKFWPCSQVRTDRDIMEITREDLKEWDRTKDCQDQCGVWCIVEMSVAMNDPVSYVKREAAARTRSAVLGSIRKGRELVRKATGRDPAPRPAVRPEGPAGNGRGRGMGTGNGAGPSPEERTDAKEGKGKALPMARG